MIRLGCASQGEALMTPKLVIRKRVQFIQGKIRPTCFIQAVVEPSIQAKLDEHFQQEPLFKRASYASVWPEGALQIPPGLAPHLSAFLKNDACPEITVKTITAGQQHQAGSAWEMMCFEFIAKLSFDNLVELMQAVKELESNIVYKGAAAQPMPDDIMAFKADTAVELEALAANVA